MSSEHSINRGIVHYIAETGQAMRRERSHKATLGNTFDTVASHSFHTALIAFVLARKEGLSKEEGYRAAFMGLLHDCAEVRTGDLDFVAKHYGKQDEVKAMEDLTANLQPEIAKDLLDDFLEYEKRETPISKCVKDADVLEQMYQEWVLADMGNKEAKRWFDGDFQHRVPFLKTKSAKWIALMMKDLNPSSWWRKNFVDEGIDYKILNGKD